MPAIARAAVNEQPIEAVAPEVRDIGKRSHRWTFRRLGIRRPSDLSKSDRRIEEPTSRGHEAIMITSWHPGDILGEKRDARCEDDLH